MVLLYEFWTLVGYVFEIFRTLPCMYIHNVHVYQCIMYVLIQALVLQYPIFILYLQQICD